MAQRLELQPVDIAYSVGISGAPEQSTIFSALVAIEKADLANTQVLIWEEDYALLGRDLINQWRLWLDGPEMALTIWERGNS